MPRIPVILHVDMDAFFVSVEERYDPSLRGKPVIVGGRPDQRGVVAAASYAARRYGIHSAMPLTRAVRLCPQAIFLPVRRDRYTAASEQIREIFRKFSPQVEMVSVDEAYLNLTGTERLFGSPLRAAHLLHQEIAREARLPCSIGISRSRAVSKIASDQAKPNGILWVMPGREAAFLAPLSVGKIPGVGKVTEKDLLRLGIRTIGDMQRRRASGVLEKARFLLPLVEEEYGETDEWDSEAHAKSVGHEETFGQDTLDPSVLDSTLADLAQRVAARLRDQQLYARTITLKLRFSNFHTITRARTLAESTNLDASILETARALLRQHGNPQRKVRLLGIQACALSTSAGQGNLWAAPREGKTLRALAAADRLRERFGFSMVQLAAALPADEKDKTEATATHGKSTKRS